MKQTKIAPDALWVRTTFSAGDREYHQGDILEPEVWETFRPTLRRAMIDQMRVLRGGPGGDDSKPI